MPERSSSSSPGAKLSAVTVGAGSPPKTETKPRGPSSASSAAVNPRAASSAAATPWKAALPACSGLTMEPKFWRMPAADEAPMPIAVAMPVSSSPSRRAEAAAAATVPAVLVACQPAA